MGKNGFDMVKLAYKAADDKKAFDIKVLDISGISVIADYFLIVSGNNLTQVDTIKDNIQDVLGRKGYFAKNVEGNQHSGWILLDYGDLIVHIFTKDDRAFYNLERVWKDGKDVTEEVSAE